MKDFLPDLPAQEAGQGFLAAMSANLERIFDNVREILQRVLDNPHFMNQIKEIFEKLI